MERERERGGPLPSGLKSHCVATKALPPALPVCFFPPSPSFAPPLFFPDASDRFTDTPHVIEALA